jgi:hypothetical protein
MEGLKPEMAGVVLVCCGGMVLGVEWSWSLLLWSMNCGPDNGPSAVGTQT